jgi:hypothetical protein
MLLHLRALWQLLRFQYYVTRGDFSLLYRRVRDYPRKAGISSSELIDRMCEAMDIVCVCYPKRVLCLQRSAATACLLRQYGVPADLVIGIQKLPFKAHAWVEADGRVVNDKPYTREMYCVLDRC